MSQNKTAPKYIILLIAVFFASVLFFLVSTPTYSQTAQELEQIINQKEEELNKHKTYLSEIEKRIKEISSSNYTLSEQINLLDAEISKLQAEISKKDKEIEEKLKSIDEKQKLLNEKKESLDIVSSDLYMRSRYSEGQFLFSFSSLDQVIRSLFIKKNTITTLKQEIEKITGEFQSLVDVKAGLEKEKEELDKQKKDLADSYALIQKEKNRVQAELNKQIAEKGKIARTINGLTMELSDLQYQLLITRQGGTYVDPNAVPASGERITTLRGFMDSAPAGSFGVFSIGAYTHRNGMSQWGAKARANAGQTYDQILAAYYPGKVLRTGSVVINGVEQNIMTNISTTTYGTLNFEEDYLLRLNEVPESWPMEVLKAQAIAARTYAINYTSNGAKSICTSESCQVVGKSKKTGAWKQAVESTRGMVLTDSSGKPFSTQYAAVHGGWSNTSGWDTTDKTGNGDWMSRAWDSISGVSWFYKIWYRGEPPKNWYSDTAPNCGRNPWMTQEEMADIINIYQIWKASGEKGDSRIYPVVDACHSNIGQYTYAEARAKAAKPVTSISSVAVSSSNGTTNAVTFHTNAGIFVISGKDFKTVFNLRAPGRLRIPQRDFVHINIHMK